MTVIVPSDADPLVERCAGPGEPRWRFTDLAFHGLGLDLVVSFRTHGKPDFGWADAWVDFTPAGMRLVVDTTDPVLLAAAPDPFTPAETTLMLTTALGDLTARGNGTGSVDPLTHSDRRTKLTNLLAIYDLPDIAERAAALAMVASDRRLRWEQIAPAVSAATRPAPDGA